MPVNKPTISHQLKSVRLQKPKTTSIIHSNGFVVPFSPSSRSHLITGHQNSKPAVYGSNADNSVNTPPLSNSQLKKCTKLLRNMLSSEGNKSTSTDDNQSCRVTSSQCGPIELPDFSHSADLRSCPANHHEFSDGLDERTDAESLTSVSNQKPAVVSDSQLKTTKSICSHSQYNQAPYCSCNNPHFSMHDSRAPHARGDSHKSSVVGNGSGDHSQHAVCTRCHNIIPQQDRPVLDEVNFRKSQGDEYNTNKVLDFHNQNHHKPQPVSARDDYSTTHNYIGDVASTGNKAEDFMSYLHVKINELRAIARLTRDADTSRIVCEIERASQQMIRENVLLHNHLKTLAKALKWENSALKQKIKNHTESNRDMKSELKLIRQEHKQKIEELKLECQLKTEEIRQITDREKINSTQFKEKYNQLEKEHDKLRSEFQSQVLLACHKDTDIIQLKHTCAQNETKLKDEIHSLTLANQNMKQELQTCQTMCRKYEQETYHNQGIIKAAREQVVNLLDRHKQNRGLDVNGCNFRFEPSCDVTSASGDWINQAASLQQVLSMATDIRDKQYSSTGNQYCHLLPPDPTNTTTVSNTSFVHTNFNNNYVSPSAYSHNILDTTNQGSVTEVTPCPQQPSVLRMSMSQKSSSNVSSSTLSDCSLPTSGDVLNIENLRGLDEIHINKSNGRQDSVSSEDAKYEPWSLPQPSGFRKVSSVSSVMSTVSSFRSSDDREFRKGLKRLDCQISRLQNTLQTNLQCK